jgi:hypothetical protein
MSRLVMTITVKDENGRVVSDSIREEVLLARQELCDILNGEHGAIEKYNEFANMLGIDDAENDVYIDAYEMLTNECWSKLLQKRGYQYKIIKERLYEPTNIFDIMRGIIYNCVITISKI